MKNKIFIIIITILSLFSFINVSADELCSNNGYTILFINGILGNENDTIQNRNKLASKFETTYRNEKLKVDYIYNPSHLAGAQDTIDIFTQSYFNGASDFDFINIVKDISKKVTTQKVLLVAHSQGNFYANNFYDKVVSDEGVIPSQSIGVYGVGTPDNRVAGNGKYLTSDTDKVINNVASKFLKFNILPPNVHIELKPTDGDGHSFSDVYMEYQGDRIVSDIKSLLNKLKSNDVQNTNEPCISASELSVGEKIAYNTSKIFFGATDPLVDFSNRIADGAENVGIAVARIFQNLLASAGGSLNDTDNALPVSPEEGEVLLGEGETPPANEKITPVSDNREENILGESNEVDEKTEPLIANNSNPVIHHHRSGGGSTTTSEETTTPLVVDTTSPVISLIGESIVDVIKDTLYIDAGAIATDNIDGDLTFTIVKGGTFVDTTTIGTYTITYTAKDNSNNSSTVTRTINVIENTIPPVDEQEEVLTIIDVDTILTYGEYFYDNLHITNNAKLILESNPDTTDSFKGVKINAKNIIVDDGSAILADAEGYMKGPGSPDNSEDNAGANYGGKGMWNTKSANYGNSKEPTDLGSGGYEGYKGGGAIELFVSNSLSNNGIISANGNLTSSGGSIYIKAKNLIGGGIYKASGGGMLASNKHYGPGGGGRIALYYENNLFTGKAEAIGGCGSLDGYSMVCAENGTVGFFDSINNNLTIYSTWKFEKSNSPFNFNKIIFTEKAVVASENDSEVNADEIDIDNGSSFALAENQILNIPIINIKNSSLFKFDGNEKITSDTMTVSGNSTVTIVPEKILLLTITNLTVDSGSFFTVDSTGYGRGPGTPQPIQEYAGATYGGIGYTNTLTPTYGDEDEPKDFGSGGTGNFRGGGAMDLNITDTLINNGIISSNGDATSTGGSIYINSKNISGAGAFNANGGGTYSGSNIYKTGGGGRIALYYDSYSFTGKVEALGGCGYCNGNFCAGDGTVKIVDKTIPVLSSNKTISSFNFEDLTPIVSGEINDSEHTISITVPYGTNVSNLIPKIITSDKSLISPNSLVSQDFSNPMTYTVTAENSTTQSYIVTVTILPNPNLIPNSEL